MIIPKDDNHDRDDLYKDEYKDVFIHSQQKNLKYIYRVIQGVCIHYIHYIL